MFTPLTNRFREFCLFAVLQLAPSQNKFHSSSATLLPSLSGVAVPLPPLFCPFCLPRTQASGTSRCTRLVHRKRKQLHHTPTTSFLFIFLLLILQAREAHMHYWLDTYDEIFGNPLLGSISCSRSTNLCSSSPILPSYSLSCAS